METLYPILHIQCYPLPDVFWLQYEAQNDALLENLREVESHKQDLDLTLSDLTSELNDMRAREKALLLSAKEEAEGTALESATEMKQAFEEEIEEREARHVSKVRKLQAGIAEKEAEINNITK